MGNFTIVYVLFSKSLYILFYIESVNIYYLIYNTMQYNGNKLKCAYLFDLVDYRMIFLAFLNRHDSS